LEKERRRVAHGDRELALTGFCPWRLPMKSLRSLSILNIRAVRLPVAVAPASSPSSRRRSPLLLEPLEDRTVLDAILTIVTAGKPMGAYFLYTYDVELTPGSALSGSGGG